MRLKTAGAAFRLRLLSTQLRRSSRGHGSAVSLAASATCDLVVFMRAALCDLRLDEAPSVSASLQNVSPGYFRSGGTCGMTAGGRKARDDTGVSETINLSGCPRAQVKAVTSTRIHGGETTASYVVLAPSVAANVFFQRTGADLPGGL